MKTPNRFIRVVLLNLICLGFFAQQITPAQNYGLTDLGFPPAGGVGSASEAHGINSKGSVVGTWWPPAQGNHGSQYAFLYSGGTNKDLKTIKSGGYDYAIAYAINQTNQIVGQGTTSGGGGYTYHAFIYSNGVMVDLDQTGQSWSSGNAINARGQIAGEFTTTVPLGLIHAFLYTNAAFLDLGTLAGGTYSSAKGINDSGVIVGESSDASGNVYAFIYSNRVMTSLGTLGGNYSSARAINNAGVIVGEAAVASGEVHAFIYTNGVMGDLGTFGGTNSTATGINNGGVVTGYALTADESAHAFVYSGSNLLDLHQAFIPPTGWTNVFLTLAYGINDAGQVAGAVNYYTNGAVNYDAMLLTPPAITLMVSNNITVIPNGQGGATVFFSVAAAGGCSRPVVSATPPSGSTFPPGTNLVNVAAVDLCGHTNTTSFQIIVNLGSPLVLNCPSGVTASAPFSNGVPVSFSATASGGCSTPTIVATPPSGSTFPLGTNTVNVTAFDTCGHTNTASFPVIVNFSPQLVLNNPSNITVTAPNSNGVAVFFSATVSSGCGPVTIVSTPPSGSLFPVGITTVTNVATDGCGNSTNATFTVTVNFNPTLALNCPADITVTAPDANGAIVTFNVTASGGCSTPDVESTPPSGSLFPIGTTVVTNTASDTCGDTTNATFNVTVNPPPAPVVLDAPVILNNQLQLTFEGVPGQNFIIQMSTNFTDWTSLITNTLVSTPMNWLDPDGLSDACRFYRVVTLP